MDRVDPITKDAVCTLADVITENRRLTSKVQTLTKQLIMAQNMAAAGCTCFHEDTLSHKQMSEKAKHSIYTPLPIPKLPHSGNLA